MTKTEAAKTQSTEKTLPTPSHEEADPSVDEPNIPFQKNENAQNEDSTEDPIVDVNSDSPRKPIEYSPTTQRVHTGYAHNMEPIEGNLNNTLPLLIRSL